MEYLNKFISNVKTFLGNKNDINGADASYMLIDKPTVETMKQIGSCILYEKLTEDDFQRYTDGQLNTILIFKSLKYRKMSNEYIDKVFSVVREMGKNGLFHLVYGVNDSNCIRYFYVLKGDASNSISELKNITTYIANMKSAGADIVEVVDMSSVINNGSTFPPTIEREYVIMFTVKDEE